MPRLKNFDYKLEPDDVSVGDEHTNAAGWTRRVIGFVYKDGMCNFEIRTVVGPKKGRYKEGTVHVIAPWSYCKWASS